jgi:hypothetical protein
MPTKQPKRTFVTEKVKGNPQGVKVAKPGLKGSLKKPSK